jgi:hypothetical protein
VAPSWRTHLLLRPDLQHCCIGNKVWNSHLLSILSKHSRSVISGQFWTVDLTLISIMTFYTCWKIYLCPPAFKQELHWFVNLPWKFFSAIEIALIYYRLK